MSNRELPMMPWYPDQFQASTVAWTFAERSLYRSLLDAQWQLGVLPPDPQRLRLIVGMDETQFDSAWEIVSTKFVPTEGGIINPRLEYHRLTALKRKQRASTAGQAGGKASAAATVKRRSTTAQATVEATVQAVVNPPSPSPDLKTPLPPQSGGLNGHANGKGTPRALGTNPRALAEKETEERRWAPLRERAEACGFRDPRPADTPETYETSLRLFEREFRS